MLTLAEAFAKFKSRQELTEREQADVSRRHTEVRAVVAGGLRVERDFLTGSYPRWTKTKPLKDVDVFFVLHEDERGYRRRPPRDILVKIEGILVPVYGRAHVTIDRMAVTVDFGVPVSEDDETDDQVMSIDVVPAFAKDDHYEIPDALLGRWIETNPETHAQLAVDAHEAYQREWKPLVRMAKKWNRQHDQPVMPSFLLEVMALGLLVPPFSGGYPYELKAFFADAAHRIHDTWPDPAGLGPAVSSGMTATQQDVARRALLEAEGTVTRAILLERQGKIGDALRVWRTLFGPRVSAVVSAGTMESGSRVVDTGEPGSGDQGDRVSTQAVTTAVNPGSAPGSIAERQNRPWSIQLLAAQRQLYSEAKWWRSAGVWSVTTMATIGVAVALTAPELLKLIGSVGVVVGLAQWGASVIERRRTKMAANVQEQFDTLVYPLRWNLMMGSKVDAEDVIAADLRHTGDRATLANWYSVPNGVPHPLDVLLCQRTNLRWDAELRRAYANTIVVTLVALFAATVVVGLLRVLSLEEFLLALLPSAGATRLGLETVRSHRQHASSQVELKRKVETAWEKVRVDSCSVRAAELRAIQDGIYNLRMVAPMVPDGFYWKKRDQFEHEMQQTVERMWEEAQVTAAPIQA